MKQTDYENSVALTKIRAAWEMLRNIAFLGDALTTEDEVRAQEVIDGMALKVQARVSEALNSIMQPNKPGVWDVTHAHTKACERALVKLIDGELKARLEDGPQQFRFISELQMIGWREWAFVRADL